VTARRKTPAHSLKIQNGVSQDDLDNLASRMYRLGIRHGREDGRIDLLAEIRSGLEARWKEHTDIAGSLAFALHLLEDVPALLDGRDPELERIVEGVDD